MLLIGHAVLLSVLGTAQHLCARLYQAAWFDRSCGLAFCSVTLLDADLLQFGGKG